MGIGRTFEEAYQKAIRMLDLDFEGAANDEIFSKTGKKDLENLLTHPTPTRMFALSQALKNGMKVLDLYHLTGIDPWFLYRVKNIVDEEIALKSKKIKLDSA